MNKKRISLCTAENISLLQKLKNQINISRQSDQKKVSQKKVSRQKNISSQSDRKYVSGQSKTIDRKISSKTTKVQHTTHANTLKIRNFTTPKRVQPFKKE